MGTKLSDVLTGMYMLKTDAARNLHFHTAGRCLIDLVMNVGIT